VPIRTSNRRKFNTSYTKRSSTDLPYSEFPAFKCITHKRLHFLPQLVAAGADLHKPKGIIETAVAHNDKEAILYLLDQGVNPNDRCPEGGATALTTAIRENRGELVDLLLSNGADPSIRGENWPLCMAVKQPPILKKLLAATPNPRAFRGKSSPVYLENKVYVFLIHENRLDIPSAFNISRSMLTILPSLLGVVEMAVLAGQLESIKLLLAAGVSVEDKNCGVFSPLTTAIREGRKDIVRYLLDVAGADPNAPGEHLPMVKALRKYKGDKEIIQMLLARGGKRCFYELNVRHTYTDVLSTAEINVMHRGWNPVLQAVENGDAEILKLLIDMGGPVDLQVVNEDGRPVVDIVTERGWEEGLALLFPDAAPANPGSKATTKQ